MRLASVGVVLLLLMGCASQPYHVTAIDKPSRTITSTCFYSKHLRCHVYEHGGKSNEATQLCRHLGWGEDSLRTGKPRVIENPWGIGGRIEQDFKCYTALATS
ncbi:MAG: hypothetical protein OXG15_05705 [Gammaproteobacteria bacterium]|nr:hypothetical protein [Gammaproteobacteria bacterium]